MHSFRSAHVVGDFPRYKNMFFQRGWIVRDTIQESDIVVFCGGADVSPCMYKEEPITGTTVNVDRDIYEVQMFGLARKLKKPMVGICRGAQFLHVMNGGSLWQDVNNHAMVGYHKISLDKSLHNVFKHTDIYVTSTHHQMMKDDAALGGKLIGWCNRSTRKEGDKCSWLNDNPPEGTDPEIIYYEKTSSLCYQPHPETTHKDHDCQNLFFHLMNYYFFIDWKKEE